MCLFPLAGSVLVGFCHRWIDVDGAEDLVQPQAVAHGQHVLGNQIAGVFADDGRAQDAVLAGHCEHLDEAVRLAVGNGAIEFLIVIVIIAAFFVRYLNNVQSLRHRFERQSHLLEITLANIDQGISMVDEDLKLVVMNDRFYEILDFPRDQMPVGIPLRKAFEINARRGEYGDGDISEQIEARIELARRMEPHQKEELLQKSVI